MAQVSRPYHVVGDVAGLPDHAFGTRSIVFWGTLAFMLVEGMGFVLGGGAYLYLRGQAVDWPPGSTRPPDLLWGTLFTLVMLISVWPNKMADKAARNYDKPGVQLWLLVTFGFALLGLVIRAFELPHLNCRWDADAYGSIVWALMILHTSHIGTDAIDTGVLSAFMFRSDVDAERFVDVEDNAGYWIFVVVTWLPIYALVYWAPRLM
jgi:cytochrome c oxidase subunit 3